jgi:hypothetical protein
MAGVVVPPTACPDGHDYSASGWSVSSVWSAPLVFAAEPASSKPGGDGRLDHVALSAAVANFGLNRYWLIDSLLFRLDAVMAT